MSSGETTVEVEKLEPPSQPSTAGSGFGSSPADVLLAAEIERVRGFCKLTLLSIVGLLAALPLFDGDPTVEHVMTVCLVLGLLSGFGFYLWIHDASRYTHRVTLLISLSAVINSQIVVVYFGVFSAAVMLLVLAIHLVSRSESALAGPVVYAVTAVQQALCAGLIITGVVDDPGLMQPAGVTLFEQVLSQVFIQGVFLVTYLMGHATRETTTKAMYDLQRAMRIAAQRGALLDEARADLDMALQVGEPGPFSGRVLGEYRLEEVIGRGAMGDVYGASHVGSQVRAAVKLLPASVLGDMRYVERFMRETRAAGAIESPHVVRVLAVSDPNAPLPYLIMERLDGYDLAQQLRRTPQLSLDEVCELVEQVGSVVDVARSKGIVHRDLKPQNIYFSHAAGGHGVWKVLDFGVAALADQSGNLSQGQAVGTPSYMSPEQARSQAVDHRADLYAVTAIAYRCITGRPAFAASDVPAVLYDVVNKMPERPSSLVDVPEDVDAVVAIGLAKRREARFGSGRELAAAFAAASRGALDDGLRQRAAALVARWPWGVRR